MIPSIRMDIEQKNYTADSVNFEKNFENSLALSSKFKERHAQFPVILFLDALETFLPIGIRMDVHPGNTSTWEFLMGMDDIEQKKQVKKFIVLFHSWKTDKQAKINYVLRHLCDSNKQKSKEMVLIKVTIVFTPWGIVSDG